MLSSPVHSYTSQQLCQSSTILQQTNGLDNVEWNVASTSENSDNDFIPSSTFNDTWVDIFHEDLGTKGLTKLTTVGGEHSYADVDQVPSLESIESDAGICLHIRKLVY
uniref:Uncharacterized protein n=2 Tax=Bactrocera latifrons TaxID=174628 RepID=A0A0K8VUK4_BACLA